jgi:hypothetical protein
MLSTVAKIMGLGLILLGFLSIFWKGNGPWIFGQMADSTLQHCTYLVTGAVLVLAGFISNRLSRKTFLVVGVIYGVLSMLGFVTGDSVVFQLVPHNIPSAWLHLSLAAIAVAFGALTEADRTIRDEQTV